MLRFRIAKNTEVYKTVCAAKEKRVTAYPAVTLCHFVAGPTRLELATSGVTAVPKYTPPCDFNHLKHSQND